MIHYFDENDLLLSLWIGNADTLRGQHFQIALAYEKLCVDIVFLPQWEDLLKTFCIPISDPFLSNVPVISSRPAG